MTVNSCDTRLSCSQNFVGNGNGGYPLIYITFSNSGTAQMKKNMPENKHLPYPNKEKTSQKPKPNAKKQ